jgi:membrane-anchored mycosin MYCP
VREANRQGKWGHRPSRNLLPRVVAIIVVLLASAFVTDSATASARGAEATSPSSKQAAGSSQCTPGSVQLSSATPSALALLQSTEAWNRSTGAGITVAVVDSGVDASNPHLVGAVIGGTNLVGDGENLSGLTDLDGHGTAIAGEIAARPLAGSGVVGLAHGAKILSVRVFRGTDDESTKAGFGPSVDKLAQGIRYATDHGATIINVSLSDYAENTALRTAVGYATSRGSLVVASAGNRATSTDKTDGTRYPAGYPEVLGVTATTEAGQATEDSIHGSHVRVAAPGSKILTSATGAGDCMYATDAPSSSFATGYVSAAAALVAQTYPSESPAQWIYRLEATALRDNPDARNDFTGWGIVQPASALVLVPSSTTRGPRSPFVNTDSRSPLTHEGVVVAAETVSARDDSNHDFLISIGIIGATALGALALVTTIRRRKTKQSN